MVQSGFVILLKMACTQYVCIIVDKQNSAHDLLLSKICFTLLPGLCAYLDNNSAIQMYSCDHFIHGCPDSWFYSYKAYECTN